MSLKSINIFSLISKTSPFIYVLAGFLFLISLDGFGKSIGKIAILASTVINAVYIITYIFSPNYVKYLSSLLFINSNTNKEKIGGLLFVISLILDLILLPHYNDFFTPEFSLIKLLIYLSLFILSLPNILGFVPNKNFKNWGGSFYLFIIVSFLILLNESVGKNAALFESEFPILPILAVIFIITLLISPNIIQRLPIYGFAIIVLIILITILSSNIYSVLWGDRISVLAIIPLLFISLGYWGEISEELQNSFFSFIFGVLILTLYVASYKAEIIKSVEMYIPLITKYYGYSVICITAIDSLIAIGAIIYAIQTKKNLKPAPNKA